WRALCGVIGAADLDALTMPQRREREDENERRIDAWTSVRVASMARQERQRAGVPAGVAYGASDLLEEPHLKTRGFWQMRERAFIGTSPNPSAPYRTDASPLPVRDVAPTLGQHNREVLIGILGLTEAEVADLEARAVVGTRPRS